MKKEGWLVGVVGGVVGALIGLGGSGFFSASESAPVADPEQARSAIAEYYRAENAATVSPHTLRLRMDKGDQSFVLVDLRSRAEYREEHVVGAVNVPAGELEPEELVAAFRKLSEGKEVITYCYSAACMLARKTGLVLAENGLYVKHLNIGWNEWRHHWRLWNSEGEWGTTRVEDYLHSGDEPGVPRVINLPAPCQEGELSC